MENALLLGMGKVGSLVGLLLNENFKVKAVDVNLSHYVYNFPFEILKADVTDENWIKEEIKKHDAVVSALPYFLNKSVAQIAHDEEVHYFDLTEDVTTTKFIQGLEKTSKKILAPQCGLAPGFIGIVGKDLCASFERLRDIELRVGALPRYPNGQLAYSFTWSPHGVINEYLNDAEAIHNGKRKWVPFLEGFEYINIEGQEFEAFTTSGGLGTLCETFEGKVDTLNYKTIRYPGHGKLMKFLMYELILKEDKKQLERILSNAKPPVEEDVVYVYAIVEGWQKNTLSRKEYYKAFYPIEIHGKKWRAISWKTAASLVGVVEMVANKTLPQKGFLKQEEIPFDKFLETPTGSLFLS